MPHDLPDWLESKISPEPNSGCWLWTAAVDRDGYGRIALGRFRGKKQHHPAHRLIYEFYHGPVLDMLDMDHLCRNSYCVNPDHLEPVTGYVNIMRGDSVSTRNAAKEHCLHGHSLHDAYIVGRDRKCRLCSKARANARYRANREEILKRRKARAQACN